jgi:hypothetical protein
VWSVGCGPSAGGVRGVECAPIADRRLRSVQLLVYVWRSIWVRVKGKGWRASTRSVSLQLWVEGCIL